MRNSASRAADHVKARFNARAREPWRARSRVLHMHRAAAAAAAATAAAAAAVAKPFQYPR